MLQIMRKHAKFLYVFFFIVIISFIFWGVGANSFKDERDDTVAVVGDQKISYKEFEMVYRNMREFYQELLKEKFDQEADKRVRETALRRIVDDKVLVAAAQDMGLAVTDKEVQDAIVHNPTFMRDGVFRYDIYERAVKLSFRVPPDIYESMLRKELLANKMRRLILSTADLTPTDIKGIPAADEKKADEVKQAMLSNKREAVLQSYMASLRKSMNVQENKNLIY